LKPSYCRRLDPGATRCGGQAGRDPRRRRDLHLVPHGSRKEKEKAIRKRFFYAYERRLCKPWRKDIAGGRLKDRYKMERRLGRIQARHPQVNDLFEVALRDTHAEYAWCGQ